MAKALNRFIIMELREPTKKDLDKTVALDTDNKIRLGNQE